MTPAPTASPAPAPGGAPAPEEELARARLRGKRAALVLVIAVAVVFIGWSAVQIIPAVFGLGVRPLPAGPPGSSERTCAEGISRLEQARERAAAAAPPNATAAPPPGPEWQDAPAVAQACSRSGEGQDAWAALLRLRSAEEQLGAGPAARPELEPLRRDVIAHLPADLR